MRVFAWLRQSVVIPVTTAFFVAGTGWVWTASSIAHHRARDAERPAVLSQEKKITTFTPEPRLPRGYNHAQALKDLAALAGDADGAALSRVRRWAFAHCFGGQRPGGHALEQPPCAKALWLSLSCEAVMRGQASDAEALHEMEFLQSQRGLDSATVAFFKQLFTQPPPEWPARAADYLRGWLVAQGRGAISSEESAAAWRAIKDGFTALSFLLPPRSEKKQNAAQSEF